MLAVFQRMSQGVLAVMGEDSLLRGNTPCRVNIEHGVQVVGMDTMREDNIVVERSVGTIDVSHMPKVGDALTHPDGTFRLDAIYADNGSNKRFILIRV